MAAEPKDHQETAAAQPEDSPEVQRHKALLRMLGHVKDALRIEPLILYRGIALAGYNANLNAKIHNADPGLKARWAADDAEALLAVGSDEVST